VSKKPTYHIVSHSHWDREWYFPFERFRAMLVDMIEDLLVILEKDPEFRSYTLDGQLAAVMDYLEVRPDREETIRRLVESKRLFIGPWYILNDEFLSSGESHIRNLALGIRSGDALGGAMRIGYIPDQFGHIAQMPQILRGFGIDTALIYRGFGGEKGQEPSEYWWISPDGTKVLMHHLPKDGYSAGYFGTKNKDIILQKFDRLQLELDARATTSQRLFFNGGDHHWPDSDVTAAIQCLRKEHDADFKHSNFAAFFDAVKGELESAERLNRLEGETRFGYRHAFAVLGGVFSSRMYLKQLNAACQTELERVLEPLNVLGSVAGMRSKAPQIEQAWKYVLQNQDHDAICGTSVDEVHREMVVRYQKARQIGKHVKAECLAALLPYDEHEFHDDRYVFVFNPSPFVRDEVLETDVEFYLQDIVVGLNPEVKIGEKLPLVAGFKLIDPDGNEVPFQIQKREEALGVTYSKHDYPHQTLVDRFTILLSAHSVPAVGWKGLRIVKAKSFSQYENEVRSGENFIENDTLRVEVRDGAKVFLKDRLSDNEYGPLNFFEDSGDVGDEYNYSYPEQDEIFTSAQFPVEVSVDERGPLRATLKLMHKLMLPVSAASDEKSRSVEKKELLTITWLSLSKNSRRLDIKTSLHNAISDHRLRAIFKTGVDTNVSYAETPFAVVKRQHQEYDISQFPYEHPAQVAPMQRFVTIRDGKRGFTLLAKGLPEYELKLSERGVLALTLLRCVGKLSGRNLITRPGGAAGWWNPTPEAQCHGDHTFEYSIVPHGGDGSSSWPLILREAECFAVPLLPFSRKNQQIAQVGSFVSVEPPSLVMTSLKLADDGKGIIIRLNNPVDLSVQGVVHFERPVEGAQRAMMNESALGSMPIKDGKEIELQVKPFEVVTVRVDL
jgi:alpha-mannosidase